MVSINSEKVRLAELGVQFEREGTGSCIISEKKYREQISLVRENTAWNTQIQGEASCDQQ
jgi:hypothetical protein